jgi:endonuclease I
MKPTLFFALWTSFLAARLPCPPQSYTWSKEHVLPKSLFPPVVTSNPDNIIPLPTKINNSRGSRPYYNQWEDGYVIYTCKSCPTPGFCSGAAVMTSRGMLPPETFRGPIARSVLRSIARFPKLAKKITDEVLDYDTAIKWDKMYPMTTEEHDYRSNSS